MCIQCKDIDLTIIKFYISIWTNDTLIANHLLNEERNKRYSLIRTLQSGNKNSKSMRQ